MIQDLSCRVTERSSYFYSWIRGIHSQDQYVRRILKIMEHEDPKRELGHSSPDGNDTDSGTCQGNNANEQKKMNDGADAEMVPRERKNPSGLDSDFRDKYIVDWDGESDPLCPRNWSLRGKWANLAVVSCLAFLT